MPIPLDRDADRVRLAAFPKCYLEAISEGSMPLDQWIEQARSLPAEGLEMYERFLPADDDATAREVAEKIEAAGFAMPMYCCSPDFTNPDPDARSREVERQIRNIEITALLGGPGAVCRILSGQNRPELDPEQLTAWVIECIEQVLPEASRCGVTLGMENHFKDGYWRHPEFAQSSSRFLRIVNAIPRDAAFGVQYDPSNAVVAGEDPLQLLDAVADRVVSMHASDRRLVEGATLDQLKESEGELGYSPLLVHGVTGEGLNDYPAILQRLAAAGYRGWISIEDGMNGMDEMRRSLEFLDQAAREAGLR